MENKMAKNRPSPKNEDAYIQAYKDLNPKANKHDHYDIAAVVAKDGTKGHGLLSQDLNRGHDKNYHIVRDFISDNKLKNEFNG